MSVMGIVNGSYQIEPIKAKDKDEIGHLARLVHIVEEFSC